VSGITARPVLSISKAKTRITQPAHHPSAEPPPQTGERKQPKKKANASSPLLQCLRKHWPALFPEGQPIPLQIGILEDITEHLQQAGEPFAQKQIARALAIHCRRISYLKALTRTPYRLGPHGEQTPISDEDRARAMAKLNALRQTDEQAGPVNTT
jgi:sRNA-binding protein